MIAITHVPSPRINECELTHADRVPIDVARARVQHGAYCDVLRRHGYTVISLDVNADESPDSVFVEDPAVALDDVAVLMSPGAPSRSGEPVGIVPELKKYLPVECILPPATIDGGDAPRVGRTPRVG